MTTRATILSRAFGRLGIGSYDFDVDPVQRADARTTLDAMMAEWEISGVVLGYLPSEGADNDGAQMATPTWADAAIWNNLAVRLGPEYGKAMMADLRRDAKRGYDLCLNNTISVPVDQRAQKRIYGGGDRYYRRFTGLY